MTNGSYQPRILDRELDELMTATAAVEIVGPRAVGKTETARRRATTVFELDHEPTRAVLAADPDRLTTSVPPILIDEWQRMPMSWDLVRRAVDRDRTPGRFLLTGSAAPREVPTHPGAGRIVSVRMRPMSLVERGVEKPTVSLAGLLRGERPPIDGTTPVRAEQYAHEILASGFPGLRGLPARVLRAELESYVSGVVDRDIDVAGRRVRDRTSLRRWLEAYAAAVSTVTSYERVRDAAGPGSSDKPAKATVLHYLDALQNLWLADPVPGWTPTENQLRRLTAMPKHQLADPALAASLRRVTMDSLLRGDATGARVPSHTTVFGALFESLVTLDVRVYAQAAEATVSHFRDYGGEHEVDLIVEGLDRRILMIEVKLAASVDDADVRHLRWLRDRLGPRFADAVIVTTGRDAYRRQDGIGVVPAALLGP